MYDNFSGIGTAMMRIPTPKTYMWYKPTCLFEPTANLRKRKFCPTKLYRGFCISSISNIVFIIIGLVNEKEFNLNILNFKTFP